MTAVDEKSGLPPLPKGIPPYWFEIPGHVDGIPIYWPKGVGTV